jgi:hypothetical protein
MLNTFNVMICFDYFSMERSSCMLNTFNVLGLLFHGLLFHGEVILHVEYIQCAWITFPWRGHPAC